MASQYTNSTTRCRNTYSRPAISTHDRNRRRRQESLRSQNQSQFPWEITAWGACACLLLWMVVYLAVLPVATELMSLLNS